MILPIVLSERAEAAHRLLNQTLGLHRLQAVASRDAERPSRLTVPTFDDTQVQRQAAVLRMISITEAFCADRLLDLAEGEVGPAESHVRGVMWERASATAVGTWDGIQGAYKDWFQIRPDWPRLDPLIEVRNAIAHGLGRLTRLQKKNTQKVTDKLARVGITLDNDRIVLTESDIELTRTVCADLISEVDQLAQARSPAH